MQNIAEKAQNFTQEIYTAKRTEVLKDSRGQKRIEGNKACTGSVQQADLFAVPVRETVLPPSGNTAAFPVQAVEAGSAPRPDIARMMDEYGNSLLRLCFMYLKDRQLAEDAVQETFIKVIRYYHRFDGGASEKTWVNRIAVNVCKDMLRSAWNRRVSVTESLAEIPDERDFTHAADDTLITEVMNLKPKYKEVILLYYYQDMKIAEIAKVLDAPESTVSVRLKRAREALAKRLGGWYYGE